MIKIKNLTKNYGKSRGVENINLEIKKGEVFGFIGPNGAGKSTTIRCIMGLINKSVGDIYIDNISTNSDFDKIKENIGYLPAEIHLYDDLTVEKMLKYCASFYKKDCRERITYLTKLLDLDLKKKVDELSFGNLKKLGIIIAFMHSPKLVILDEPTSGLDPLVQETFYEFLKTEKKNGTTIFFSSHVLSEIKRICDRVGIIKEGKLIKIEDVDKITSTDFSVISVWTDSASDIANKFKNILEQRDNFVKFIFKDDINTLISYFNTNPVQKLMIEEPSIEEVFMHYYKS